jgi:hypothetical protein
MCAPSGEREARASAPDTRELAAREPARHASPARQTAPVSAARPEPASRAATTWTLNQRPVAPRRAGPWIVQPSA